MVVQGRIELVPRSNRILKARVKRFPVVFFSNFESRFLVYRTELLNIKLLEINDVFECKTELLFQQNNRLFKSVGDHDKVKAIFDRLYCLLDVLRVVAVEFETQVEG